MTLRTSAFLIENAYPGQRTRLASRIDSIVDRGAKRDLT
jgi:hypothetical protein